LGHFHSSYGDNIARPGPRLRHGELAGSGLPRGGIAPAARPRRPPHRAAARPVSQQRGPRRVELLSCLEVLRDAKSIQSADPLEGDIEPVGVGPEGAAYAPTVRNRRADRGDSAPCSLGPQVVLAQAVRIPMPVFMPWPPAGEWT
jgi:hypothetical protein